MIGSLSHLFRGAVLDAILTGSEEITKKSLEAIPLDHSSDYRGESTENYIRHLARANHLKPSVLHSVACGPPNWTGKPRLDRLAVLSGRPVEHLERALTDGLVPRRRTTVTGRYETLPRGIHLPYRAIRQDAELANAFRRYPSLV